MTSPWRAEVVLSLAPDASSAAAGRRQSSPAPWSGTGVSASPPAVWGLCKGSGKNPYQTVVDLSGPAYKCSCPSRKFPCKHALGLLLLWSAGGIDARQPPEWVDTWLSGRAQKAATSTGDGAEPNAPDPQAAAKRAQQRAARVAAGGDELDTWLADQVRSGLAGLERAGYGPFDTVAARMVDAQAPGLASSVRRLPSVIASGNGWPSRLLEELALLRLTVRAHRRLDALPEPLAACVRREVGYPVPKDVVLAADPVVDTWQVLGLRDTEEDRLTSRRVWLRGARTGRPAVVLSFAPPGQALDATLVPGTAIEAGLHFYPGTAALRALVGERYGEPGPLHDPGAAVTGGSVADAVRTFAAAVAADPWTSSWPVVVSGLTVSVAQSDGQPAPSEWVGVDPLGRRLRLLAGRADMWRLLAVSGGAPVTVAGEYTPSGLWPVSVWADERLVLL